MARSPRSMSAPGGVPRSRSEPRPPARGRAAAATYLRAHLYGAALGRTLLNRCISAVDPADRDRIRPLRAQFDMEIATARHLLARISPLGTPGRRLVRVTTAVTFAALPAGPLLREPLTRLGLLESLRTLVVAKRSMWELLAGSWVADGVHSGAVRVPDDDDNDDDTVHPNDTRGLLLGLADQARRQEDLLEELRRHYGLEVFG